MNNADYYRKMGMDMIREEQRIQDLRPRIDLARMQKALEGPTIMIPNGLSREEKIEFILRHADDSEFVMGLGW